MASRTSCGRRIVAVCVAALAAAAIVHGAETPDATKPDFSGTWTLDRAISTEPAQIEFAPAATPARQSRGGFGGFGRAGGSRRRADTGSSPESLTQVEQSRLKALTEQLKTSSSTLVISHHDPDFVVNDAK